MLGRAYKARWTSEQELLATACELLSTLLIVTIKANSKKGTKVPEPLHIPRPWDEERKVVTMTPSQFAAALRSR